MRRRLIILVLVLLLGAAVWFGAPRLLRRAAFFRIRQVDLVGNRYLPDAEILRHLALADNASIFDPLDRVRAAAAALPGTVGSSASVERRFPGTLRVSIVEVVPVALAQVEGRLVPLDSRGRRLPFDPTRIATSLPIAEEDSMTAALLARLRLADQRDYDEVQTARMDHGDVLLDLGEHTVRVRPNADTETLRSIGLVREWFEQHHREWAEIDARYDGRLFARKAKA